MEKVSQEIEKNIYCEMEILHKEGKGNVVPNILYAT